MSQRGEFSRNGPSVNVVIEQMLEESSNILALRRNKRAFAFANEVCKLRQVTGVSLYREARQPLLNPEIVKETCKRALILGRREHPRIIACYRTRKNGKVGTIEPLLSGSVFLELLLNIKRTEGALRALLMLEERVDVTSID